LTGSTTLHAAARGISGNGAYIVGYVGPSATRWSDAAFTTRETLASLPSSTTPSSAGYDVSNDGSVVVGSCLTAVSTYETVIWTSAGVRRLSEVMTASGADLQGASLVNTNASAISGDGKIIAGTAKVNGELRGYIARLP
jgi:uncharacterized membrane protein